MPIDLEAYARVMGDYYDKRIDPAQDKSSQGYAEEYDRNYATEGHWARELAIAIQEYLAGRRVMEIAAGTGQWTRYLVRTARFVQASDVTERALSRLEKVVRHAQEIPTGRFEVVRLDAYRPDEAPGEFDAALIVNFFQHIPRQQHDDFITRLHRRLPSGGRVLLAINHLSPRSRARLFSNPGDPNLWEPRQTFDGRPADIIDNVFSEPDLRELFGPYAREFNFFCGIGYYWICYELR